jgi:hypothetical protein
VAAPAAAACPQESISSTGSIFILQLPDPFSTHAVAAAAAALQLCTRTSGCARCSTVCSRCAGQLVSSGMKAALQGAQATAIVEPHNSAQGFFIPGQTIHTWCTWYMDCAMMGTTLHVVLCCAVRCGTGLFRDTCRHVHVSIWVCCTCEISRLMSTLTQLPVLPELSKHTPESVAVAQQQAEACTALLLCYCCC